MNCLTCDLHNWVLEHYTWEALVHLKKQSTPFGDIEVINSKIERDDFNSYGDYDMGSSETAWVVMKLNSDGAPRFFRKEGTADSYGEVAWDKAFREVRPTTKTVVVYEWD